MSQKAKYIINLIFLPFRSLHLAKITVYFEYKMRIFNFSTVLESRSKIFVQNFSAQN